MIMYLMSKQGNKLNSKQMASYEIQDCVFKLTKDHKCDLSQSFKAVCNILSNTRK